MNATASPIVEYFQKFMERPFI